jgi:hypothetical protein
MNTYHHPLSRRSVTMALCTFFFFAQALGMNEQPRNRVVTPYTRLFFPRFSPHRELPDDLYFDAAIGGENYYQICQALYGEEISWKPEGNAAYVQGEGSISGFVNPFNLQTARTHNHFFEKMVMQRTRVIIFCPEAETFSVENVRCLLTLPMGATVYVQSSGYEDYFEFFDPVWRMLLIKKTDVITEEQLAQLDEKSLRNTIVEQAKKLIGNPFQWGGQCALEGCGFDCAGLIHTVYRSCNIMITRDVSTLCRKSSPIDPENIQPGDLIFFYRLAEREKLVDHVILYEGDDFIIESSPTAKKVIRSTFKQEFGKPIAECKNDDEFFLYGETYRVSFRSVISNSPN